MPFHSFLWPCMCVWSALLVTVSWERPGVNRCGLQPIHSFTHSSESYRATLLPSLSLSQSDVWNSTPAFKLFLQYMFTFWSPVLQTLALLFVVISCSFQVIHLRLLFTESFCNIVHSLDHLNLHTVIINPSRVIVIKGNYYKDKY